VNERCIPKKPKADAHRGESKSQDNCSGADTTRGSNGERKQDVWQERHGMRIQPSGYADVEHHEQPRTNSERDGHTRVAAKFSDRRWQRASAEADEVVKTGDSSN